MGGCFITILNNGLIGIFMSIKQLIKADIQFGIKDRLPRNIDLVHGSHAAGTIAGSILLRPIIMIRKDQQSKNSASSGKSLTVWLISVIDGVFIPTTLAAANSIRRGAPRDCRARAASHNAKPRVAAATSGWIRCARRIASRTRCRDHARD